MQVARCTKIINPNTDQAKYVINIKQIAKVCAEGGAGDRVQLRIPCPMCSAAG